MDGKSFLRHVNSNGDMQLVDSNLDDMLLLQHFVRALLLRKLRRWRTQQTPGYLLDIVGGTQAVTGWTTGTGKCAAKDF